MKVKELIQKLKEFDEDLEVEVYAWCDEALDGLGNEPSKFNIKYHGIENVREVLHIS
tara:strand:+ start:74905 stop:75075 length:171 start_codon:yes stop_codon:yes gene_type:complete